MVLWAMTQCAVLIRLLIVRNSNMALLALFSATSKASLSSPSWAVKAETVAVAVLSSWVI